MLPDVMVQLGVNGVPAPVPLVWGLGLRVLSQDEDGLWCVCSASTAEP